MLGGTDGHVLECLLNDYFFCQEDPHCRIIPHPAFKFFYTKKQVLKGTWKRMMKGLVATDFDDGKFNNCISLITIINDLITNS